MEHTVCSNALQLPTSLLFFKDKVSISNSPKVTCNSNLFYVMRSLDAIYLHFSTIVAPAIT